MSEDWIKKVTTVSTFPPKGLYTQDAKTIARVMATKEVSPLGLGSAIKMVQFYINRAGKKLPKDRRDVLKESIRLLQAKQRADNAVKMAMYQVRIQLETAISIEQIDAAIKQLEVVRSLIIKSAI